MVASPLRYPGGKAKLFPLVADLIKANTLYGKTYCEPYAGGAGLAVRLLASGFVQRVSINDIDTAIFSFWSSVLRRTDDFCALVQKTPVTIEEWERQRSILKAGDKSDPLSLGFSAFFLNRTSRSGIIEGSGPIGGKSQEGPWKIDVRLIKSKQVDNIRKLSRFAGRIEVSNLDALEYLSSLGRLEDKFLYLDPPYYVKGSNLYTNFYRHDDHIRISERLRGLASADWVVSYDDVPPIRNAYAGFDSISYSLAYSAGPSSMGAEVMFLSPSLVKPPQIH